jgi:uncharacterized protein (DUF1800 family)
LYHATVLLPSKGIAGQDRLSAPVPGCGKKGWLMSSRWFAFPLALVVWFVCGCNSAGPPPPPTNPVPTVNFVYPSTVAVSAPLTITIIGSQFISGAQVLLGSTPLTATFVDASHLTATGTAPAAAGTLNLTVTNPQSGGVPSNSFAINVAKISQRAAVRFLEQSTFGPNDSQLATVETGGMESFLAAQFQAPRSDARYPIPPPPEIFDLSQVQSTFFQNALDATATSDQLRQRVVFVLNQIWVTSGNKLAAPDVYVPYLQTLGNDAFGNYRKLMEDVTLNPEMGFYLDMANNVKPAPGAHANENYAREFMQLFTIGPNILSLDGTPVLSATGAFVPTYTQTDIEQLALVFTGWTFDAGPTTDHCVWTYFSGFGGVPMTYCDANHNMTAKTLLTTPIPAGQTSPQDLKSALDIVFNHPNLPPFVARRFIQHLVTSNPSPTYVTNVANAFKNGTFTSNGVNFGVSGDRGNMQALIAAVLLDPEARRGDDPATEKPLDGHLREPVLLTTSVLRAFGASTSSDNTLVFLASGMGGELLFYSPSVFNFFSPLYQIPLTQPALSGPEFQIYTSASSLSRIDWVKAIFFGLDPRTQINLSPYVSLASNDPGTMVDAMDLQLLHGTMSEFPGMRAAILTAVSAVPASDPTTRVETAAYLITSSPQYQVQR